VARSLGEISEEHVAGIRSGDFAPRIKRDCQLFPGLAR
jgi:hypothetical protein